MIVNGSSGSGCGVSVEGAVEVDGRRVGITDGSSGVARVVVGEGAIGKERSRGVPIGDLASALDGGISPKVAVGERGGGVGFVAKGSAPVGMVVAKDTVGDGGRGLLLTIESGAAVARIGAIGEAASDDEAVENACRINKGVVGGDDVVAVVRWRSVLVDVSGENGQETGGIAVGQGDFVACESAVDGDLILQEKGGVSIIVGESCTIIGIVGAGGHPDFVARGGGADGVAKEGVGVGPRASVIGSACGRIDVVAGRRDKVGKATQDSKKE